MGGVVISRGDWGHKGWRQVKLGVGPKAGKCKGPEAGKSLVDLRAGRKATVASDGDGADWKVDGAEAPERKGPGGTGWGSIGFILGVVEAR